MIYLDNAATTFPKPQSVYDEMDRVNRTLSVNAGRGTYRAGREASNVIMETRSRLSTLFHSEGRYAPILTSSVTQGINQVLRGLKLKENMVVYVTPYEHNAVARTIEDLRKRIGFEIVFLPLCDDLRIDLNRTEFLFSEKHPSVLIMNMVSNVTGLILPCDDVISLAKRYNPFVILDASQAAGLLPIDLSDEAVDVLCFAGHKTLYGPFGIAGFMLRRGVILDTVQTGGTGSDSLNLDMPHDAPGRYEAGSPNIPAISGLNASLACLNVESHEKKVRALTKYLIQALASISKVKLLGTYDGDDQIAIVSIAIDGYNAADVGDILDEEFDIAVRTGYHCAPWIHEWLNDEVYGGTIRISVGMFSTEEEIDQLAKALRSL